MVSVPARTWVIFDHFDDTTSLIAIGQDESFAGASPRRTFDALSRRLILKPAQTAIDTGQVVDQINDLGAGRYRCVAHPIVIPDGSRVCGAASMYVPEGSTPAERPLIGTWQWRVDRSGNNVGENASQWNDDLFKIHELDPNDVGHDKGPVGEWLTRLIPAGERTEVKTTVDAGLAAANGVHQFLTFGAVTRLGTSNPGRKQLALVGTGVPVGSTGAGVFAYGFTREVPTPANDRTTGLAVVGGTQFASAMLALLNSTAIVGIDYVQSYTFVTSPSWVDLGFESDFSGDFASLATPDDRERLEEYIGRATVNSGSLEPMAVRLQTKDGPRPFRVRASAVDHDDSPSRYVLVAVDREG